MNREKRTKKRVQEQTSLPQKRWFIMMNKSFLLFAFSLLFYLGLLEPQPHDEVNTVHGQVLQNAQNHTKCHSDPGLPGEESC